MPCANSGTAGRDNLLHPASVGKFRMPTVSVVVPTYNRASFIDGAVSSVLGQSHRNLECIVVDGGSTDGTREVLGAIADDRLHVMRRERRLGLSNARNAGIERATGKYILFLDDDDRLYDGAIERFLAALEGAQSRFPGAFSGCTLVDDGTMRRTRSVPAGPLTLQGFARRNVVGGPSGTIFDRDVFTTVGTFDESYSAREDADFYVRYLQRYSLLGIDTPLYVRNRHDDQMVHDDAVMLASQRRFLADHGDVLTPAHRARRHLDVAFRASRLDRPALARRAATRSFRLDPFRKRRAFYWFWLLFGTSGYRWARRFEDWYLSVRT